MAISQVMDVQVDLVGDGVSTQITIDLEDLVLSGADMRVSPFVFERTYTYFIRGVPSAAEAFNYDTNYPLTATLEGYKMTVIFSVPLPPEHSGTRSFHLLFPGN
jgi:hypothetical protein